jgi:signal recognition particle receptor subunit beta
MVLHGLGLNWKWKLDFIAAGKNLEDYLTSEFKVAVYGDSAEKKIATMRRISREQSVKCSAPRTSGASLTCNRDLSVVNDNLV